MKNRYALLTLVIGLVFSSSMLSQNSTWVYYSKANSGIPSDSISTIAFDGSGMAWIGTPTQGMATFDGLKWTLYNDLIKVPHNGINSIMNADGNMWIGTSYGLTKTDGTSWTTYTTDNSGLADNAVWSLAHDNQNNLWIGTNSGLNKLTPDLKWTTYSSDNIPEFPDSHIQYVTTDGSGNIWASFISAYGMIKFSSANTSNAKLINENLISNFPGDHVMSITIDWNGDAWAGTFYKGLVKTDGITASVISQETNPNWISNNILSTAIDQCGHMWIGTDRGVELVYGTTIIPFTLENSSLKNDTVNTIAIDPAGHIWFGTNGGLAELKLLPQKPVLIYPTDAAMIATDSITCHWAWDCPGIVKYWYEIADNPTFVNSHIDTTSASLNESASKWDTIFTNHTTYYWRIKAKNDMGWGPFSNVWSFTVNITSGVSEVIPASSNLSQNFPNPCSDATTIRFSLTEYGHVSLKCFDVLGREITTLLESDLNKGEYNIPFNTATIPNGIYFYSLKTANGGEKRTMQVVR